MISALFSLGFIGIVFFIILGCIFGYFAAQFLIFGLEMFLTLIQCFFGDSDDDD